MLASLSLSADVFKDAAKKYNISKNVLYSIAKVESNLKPLAIGTMPRNKTEGKRLIKYLNMIDCKHKVGEKDYTRVSIFPKDKEQAKLAYMIIDKFRINYDLGLVQINRWNVEKRNLDVYKLLFDEKYNVMVGAKILSECIGYNNGNVHDSLECYNKGTNKKKYNRSYSNKIIREYRKLVSL